MTVSYTGEVATCKGFGCFLKLLFRWKGSIYKLVWPDLCMFLTLFMCLKAMYHFILTLEQREVFEKISSVCRDHGNLIPISFILGFYVSIVVGRWWDQYKSIPWTDSIAVFVSASIQGQDEKGRVMRRTIMRYCCLSMTMCFTMISPRVKKRFPTLDHLVEAGLLLDNEKDIIDEINRMCSSYNKSWIPIIWASGIVSRARKEGKIRDDFAVKTILDELNKFRAQCGLLISYDWISVPLVYTQVCTLAVYSYFAAALMGSQWVNTDNEKGGFDLVFPVFTTLQFFFYMGWLKVAESLVNPFGDDDDDFELNWLVDRNLQVSYLIVDEMHHDHPELVKDQYWDEGFPTELPYTVASEQYRDDPPQSSTAKIKLTQGEGEIVSPPSVKLDEMSDFAETGRRVSLTPSKRSSVLLQRRERTSSVRSAASQSTLAESVSGKLSRAGSITSVFKRMFSRDRDRDNLHSPSGDGRLMDFACSTSNVHRVLDEVIPELDENMTTIISMRQEHKPTVHEIFGTQKLNDAAPAQVQSIPSSPIDNNNPFPPASKFTVFNEERSASTPKDAVRPSFLQLSPTHSEGDSANKKLIEEDAAALVKGGNVKKEAAVPGEEEAGTGKSGSDFRRGSSGETLSHRLAKSLRIGKTNDSEDNDEDEKRSEKHLLSPDSDDRE